ncbi:Protein noi4 [Castilleja foliolosa]|uniref:Protein noi4 n=1 Tax=Castilleja foliolosa TaxID=1961234 RepID=A0ABD3BDJ1_9LAMI
MRGDHCTHKSQPLHLSPLQNRISILYTDAQLYSTIHGEKGLALPKFGEWDVNDPASAEGFTVIFNKARNEKRTGGKPESPPKDKSIYSDHTTIKQASTLGGKPHSKKWFCCMQSTSTES